MSQFGSQYVPSLSATTGFMASEILKYLADARKNQIENVQLFQKMQLSATQGYASAEEDTINKQADAEEDQAEATLLQGGIGLAGPITSTFYEGYRENMGGINSGISNLKQAAGFERTELGKMEFEGKNLQEWREVLQNGKAPVMSAARSNNPNEIEMDVFNDHSAQAVKETKLNALRGKSYGATNPKGDSDSELVASLNTQGGGAKDDTDPDVIKRKQLRKDVEKKIDDQEQSLQNKRSRYDNHTDLVSKRFQDLCSSFAQLGGGVKQKDAAEERKLQAAAQAVQEYAKYNSDSQAQAVQTGTKVWEDIGQTQQQASQSYFEGLARANQPA